MNIKVIARSLCPRVDRAAHSGMCGAIDHDHFQGEVVAMNTAAADEGAGSYYLPLEKVTEVLGHIIQVGMIVAGYLPGQVPAHRK